MSRFWLGFLLGIVGLVTGSMFLSKDCQASRGVSLYSSYYSSAHMVAVLGEYTDRYDIEFGGYLTANDASLRSSVTAFLVQGNLKSHLSKNLDVLYGISVEFFSDGEFKGVKYTGTGFGPYIGIERRMDENLRLRAIYHPVYISSFEVGGIKTNTTDFGLNGAIGLTYIF